MHLAQGQRHGAPHQRSSAATAPMRAGKEATHGGRVAIGGSAPQRHCRGVSCRALRPRLFVARVSRPAAARRAAQRRAARSGPAPPTRRALEARAPSATRRRRDDDGRRAGLGVEDDLRFAAFELAHDVAHLLVEGALAHAVVGALAVDEFLDHAAQRRRRSARRAARRSVPTARHPCAPTVAKVMRRVNPREASCLRCGV